MKKTLLTLGAVLGVSAMAFAQGSISVQNAGQVNSAGFNTVSSSPSDLTLSDYISGTVSLEIFSAPYSSTVLSEAQTINSDAGLGTQLGLTEAETALNADFTQQQWGASAGTEGSTVNVTVSNGTIPPADQLTEVIGSSTSLTSGSSVLYALLATWSNGGHTYTGVLALDGVSGYGAGGGSFPPANMNSDWPDQNFLLTTVPEPTTLALAGLGGLSMLFLRRRKA